MTTIWKFELKVNDEYQRHDMPEGSRILSVQAQNDLICAWVKVFLDAPMRTRAFRVRGTGHPWAAGEEWVGTVQMPPFVWHLLEVCPPSMLQ